MDFFTFCKAANSIRIDRYSWVYIFSFSISFTHYSKIVIESNHPVIPVDYHMPIILQGSEFVAYFSLVCSPTKNRFLTKFQAPKTSQNPKGSGATAGHYVWSLIEWQEGKPQEIASLT